MSRPFTKREIMETYRNEHAKYLSRTLLAEREQQLVKELEEARERVMLMGVTAKRLLQEPEFRRLVDTIRNHEVRDSYGTLQGAVVAFESISRYPVLEANE